MKSKSFFVLLATLGPVGYRMASGTLGSLVGLVLVWFSRFLTPSMYTIAIIISVILGFIIIHYAARSFVSSDPREIVLDETIGCLIAFYGIPLTLQSAILCFLLFRFFDISKICGVGYVERISNKSWAILADDLLAGVLANLCMRLFL